MSVDSGPVIVPAGHHPSVVNCVAYREGGRREDITLQSISDVLQEEGAFVWLGLHEPDEGLLSTLQEEFGLHDLAVEDAHHAHQRPKIEAYGDSLFIVVHTAQLVDGSIAFGETHVFLGRNYLVTVRHGASLSYQPARTRCEREPEMLSLGPSYGLYAVVDYIVDNYFPIVGSFQEQLAALEQDVFSGTFHRGTILRLYHLKRELTTLRLAVAPMQDILSQLQRLHPQLVREEVRVYFRDVADHAARLNEASDALREMLTGAMSVNLALVTVAQGEVVRRLAGWAALVAVPTLVASWYGMNFAHMPELSQPWGYAAVAAVTGGACLAVFLALRRAHWL